MAPDIRRRILIEAVVLGLAVVVGGVLVALQAGTVATAIGITLLGLGLVGGTIALFWEVGLSEERDRRRHPRG